MILLLPPPLLLLYLATIIVLIMLVWFKTDFVVDWFGIKEKEFLKKRIDWFPDSLTFPIFMKTTHPNFWTKLLGCPLCVSFWLSVILLVLISILTFNFLLILLIPTLCILSLFIYGIITRLMNIS